MTQPDDWIETLRRKEKADENRYFAEPDRKLIETRQRQRQPAQAANPHATVADVPAAPAPRDSAEPSAVWLTEFSGGNSDEWLPGMIHHHRPAPGTNEKQKAK